MATYVQIDPTQQLDPFKAVKKLPLEEFFTSGHRTCQGCESALVMKMMGVLRTSSIRRSQSRIKNPSQAMPGLLEPVANKGSDPLF